MVTLTEKYAPRAEVMTIVDTWDVVGGEPKQVKDGVATTKHHDRSTRVTNQQASCAAAGNH